MVIAYHQCKRKAFFLLSNEDRPFFHPCESVLTKRAEANRRKLMDGIENSDSLLNQGSFTCQDGMISQDDIEAKCDMVIRSKVQKSKPPIIFEPLIVVGTKSVTSEQILALAFAGHAVEQTQGVRPSKGFILDDKDKSHRKKLEMGRSRIDVSLKWLRKQISTKEFTPPKLILNEHCKLCPFQSKCRIEAEELDDLSLLERMTPTLAQKYQNQGIFTINQLSYKYRPRRRRKKADYTPVKFNLELQSLAIRTGKTILTRVPDIPSEPVEIFLDIEGIPQESYDYLVGLQIINKNELTSHSFWANSQADEKGMFLKFQDTVRQFGDAPIYHYGSYESKSLHRVSKKYGVEIPDIERRLVNVNQFVYGKVYFPTTSNSLKALGSALGASWQSPVKSGLDSLAWRYQWEDSPNKEDLKKGLITYNQDDCSALRLLKTELREISKTCEERMDVEFADSPKQQATEQGLALHRSFEQIIQSAHASYREGSIRIGKNYRSPGRSETKPGGVIGHPGYNRIKPKSPGRVITVRRKLKCTECKNKGMSLVPLDQVSERTIIDLAFTKSGCRKTITKYVGVKSKCHCCKKVYLPPSIHRIGSRVFGHAFKAWAVYQRVALRLPYSAIVRTIDDLFSESVTTGSIVNFITQFSKYYSFTEEQILKQILHAPFVHVDETTISISGMTHYVWVLTNGSHVLFRLTETREASFMKELLDGYDGVVISDFFAGYDGLKAQQQKCIVHLVRDLNEDLWKNPYNVTLESFIRSVGTLLDPIFKDVEKFGLKARNLRKHVRRVDRFYRDIIDCESSTCDLVSKYQKRFARYRHSLFNFLKLDGIPWNNNTAERAIRHLAVQRKISGQFSHQIATDYLRLLGIAQTCRFQEKSFLKFLCSGKKDIDMYKERKRRKSTERVNRSSS